MPTLDEPATTRAAIQQARATEQYTRAIINTRMAGFTLDLLPRRTDDMGTLVLPKHHPLPKPLLDQLIELAGFLRGRAMDGICAPVKLFVQATTQQAPN